MSKESKKILLVTDKCCHLLFGQEKKFFRPKNLSKVHKVPLHLDSIASYLRILFENAFLAMGSNKTSEIDLLLRARV